MHSEIQVLLVHQMKTKPIKPHTNYCSLNLTYQKITPD